MGDRGRERDQAGRAGNAGARCRRRGAGGIAGAFAAGALVVATACASGPGAAESPPSASATSSGSPSSSPAQGRCSAAGLSADLPEQSLPEPVDSTRSRIAKAAVECDYDALDRIAQASADGFSFSFGGQKGKPSDYWRKLEADGKTPLAFLVKALSVSHGTTMLPASSPGAVATPTPARTIYVWPAAAAKETPTDQDWAEVERLYPKEQVARMKEDSAKLGIGYLGWRAGITSPGTWIYFIEGD